jgi:hypothetical protein
VLGKGRRERALPSAADRRALDRYLRVRARHKDAALPWLRLGLRGRSPRGASSRCCGIVARRSSRAAPHQLRHTFAHQWLAQGGGETDLMRLAGWRSRTMPHRYGASAAGKRAVYWPPSSSPGRSSASSTAAGRPARPGSPGSPGRPAGRRPGPRRPAARCCGGTGRCPCRRMLPGRCWAGGTGASPGLTFGWTVTCSTSSR